MFRRFRIGGMDAAIVSDGPLVLPPAPSIFNGPDEAALNQALKERGVKTESVRVEQNCLLLNTGGRRVLFDNGMGSSKLYGPDSGQLLTSLAEAGVDAASIDALVLTHAHSDHCWGTMGDDGLPNFPNATIYMAWAELDFWVSGPPGERRERSIEGVHKHLLPLRERIQFVRDEEEFLPGVQAWFTPGHTPGHLAFLLEGGWCLTGDVAFHDPLSYTFPDAESAYDTDPLLGVATRRRLLERLVAEKLRIIGYHHPWPGLGWVERAGDAYHFIADPAG
ncbi:MAG: MBL fold metallo-hydrolase [Acetobacteraceae bacterium]|nr:MBL fold metallo-hydrolase [Acetobacteraceae bacterium]